MARDVAAVPDCPTVPIPDAGTAGQPASGTYGDGTDPGTSGGAPSLKALARLALARDSKRDASALIPPVPFPPFRDVAAVPDCPTVPIPDTGTAGQPASGTYGGGTSGGAPSLKALARLALARDSKRDASVSIPPVPFPPSVAAVTPGETQLGHWSQLGGFGLRRPPSWSDATVLPSNGCLCSCCRNRRWWCELRNPSGWRCWTCHPPDHLSAEGVKEIRT